MTPLGPPTVTAVSARARGPFAPLAPGTPASATRTTTLATLRAAS